MTSPRAASQRPSASEVEVLLDDFQKSITRLYLETPTTDAYSVDPAMSTSICEAPSSVIAEQGAGRRSISLESEMEVSGIPLRIMSQEVGLPEMQLRSPLSASVAEEPSTTEPRHALPTHGGSGRVDPALWYDSSGKLFYGRAPCLVACHAAPAKHRRPSHPFL